MRATTNEAWSVLFVAVACVVIALVTGSFWVGTAMWFGIGGIMICIRSWIIELIKEFNSARSQPR